MAKVTFKYWIIDVSDENGPGFFAFANALEHNSHNPNDAPEIISRAEDTPEGAKQSLEVALRELNLYGYDGEGEPCNVVESGDLTVEGL